MSFGELESPVINYEKGWALATKRCVSWGYNGAEVFAGATKVCSEYGGFWIACKTTTITQEYQCVD